MATVKNLEERLDDLSDELDGLKNQLAITTAKFDMNAVTLGAVQNHLASVSAQLATITVKLDTLTAQLRETNVRLDSVAAKLEGVVVDHAALKVRFDTNEEQGRRTRASVESLNEFKAKAENVFGFLRWIGASVALTMVGVIGAAVAVTNSVIRLDSNMQNQQKMFDQHQKTLDDINRQQKTLDDINRQLGEIRAKQK